MRRRRGYNEAKIVVLEHLARVGRWQDYREVAQVVGWVKSERTMASYLHKLWTWGLLFRRTVPRAEYAITSKGRARLRWLERRLP
jgi:DNA-binding PadR family transcriptional regulator